jgi:hypothetical protein
MRSLKMKKKLDCLGIALFNVRGGGRKAFRRRPTLRYRPTFGKGPPSARRGSATGRRPTGRR